MTNPRAHPAAIVSRRDFLRTGAAAALEPAALFSADRDETPPDTLIGYSELRTDLPGGRYVNVATMRAVVVKADGTGRSVLAEQLTDTPAGSMHYHPTPAPDGKWLLYGSKRDGVRQLYVMRLSDRKEWRITDLKKGHGAMWPIWQRRAVP